MVRPLHLASSVIVALMMVSLPAAAGPEATEVDPPAVTPTEGPDEPPANSPALFAASAQALGGKEDAT